MCRMQVQNLKSILLMFTLMQLMGSCFRIFGSFLLLGILLFSDVIAQNEINHCDGEDTYYSLAEALEEPEKVIKLDIAMLKLTSIDPNIAKLINLECLDLSFNRFSTLPAEIAELKKLRVLNLTGTRFLAKLPDIVAKIPNLEELDIRDHPEWKGTQFDDAIKLLPKVKVLTMND